MTPFQVLIAALAARRIFQLLTADEIFEPIRRRILGYDADGWRAPPEKVEPGKGGPFDNLHPAWALRRFLRALAICVDCASIWIVGAIVLVWQLGHGNWPGTILLWLAIAEIVILIANGQRIIAALASKE